ncbi:MAG: hypothetical protein L6W00_18860 [Lentisphaeria bacterium]|nr:MAG: hypothetical protein L6W00_18860 [Lentisphaeria bacterium]
MKTNLLWCTVFFAMLSVMAEDKTIWSCSSVSEMAGKGLYPSPPKGIAVPRRFLPMSRPRMANR